MKVAYASKSPATTSGVQLALTYVATWVCSLGTTLMTIGIYFFTAHEFGWGAARNMSLAAGMGVAYTSGALLAHRVQARFGARRALVVLHLMLAALAGNAMLMPTQWAFAANLLVYVAVAAVNWPMLESQITAGAEAREMSRRVGMYNAVWASASAAAVASAGWMIGHSPAALFAVAIACHVIGAACLAVPDAKEPSPQPSPGVPGEGERAETELVHVRTLALWLARIALPASYVVNYALSALLPSLETVRSLNPTAQTLCSSVWLAARFACFIIAGKTIFWHARPRLLLGSAFVMLGAFLGVTLLPLPAMLVSQIVLGLAMGMIYSGSLYFGMVLSDGSTEHGGYHEALIGLGSVIGPGAGALTQWLWPGDVRCAVFAVASVVAICVTSAAVASILLRRRE